MRKFHVFYCTSGCEILIIFRTSSYNAILPNLSRACTMDTLHTYIYLFFSKYFHLYIIQIFGSTRKSHPRSDNPRQRGSQKSEQFMITVLYIASLIFLPCSLKIFISGAGDIVRLLTECVQFQSVRVTYTVYSLKDIKINLDL